MVPFFNFNLLDPADSTLLARLSWTTDPFTGSVKNVEAQVDDLHLVEIRYRGPKTDSFLISDAMVSTVRVGSTNFLEADNLFGSTVKAGHVRDFDGEGVNFSTVDIRVLRHGDLEDSFGAFIRIGTLRKSFVVENSDVVTLDLGRGDGVNIIIESVDQFDGFANQFIDSSFIASDSVSVHFGVADGTGSNFDYVNVKGGGLALQSGDANVYVHGSDELVIVTGSGNDRVNVTYGGDNTVLTGQGDDFFEFRFADVAFNLGGGNDTGHVNGGNTIGNLVDGFVDTIILVAGAGGDHALFVDQLDNVLVQIGRRLHNAAQLDDITTGGRDGVIALGNFSLSISTETVSTDIGSI